MLIFIYTRPHKALSQAGKKTSMIMYLGENTQKTERTVFRIITGVNEVTYKMAQASWAVFAGRFWFLLPFGLKLFYISAKLKYF